MKKTLLAAALVTGFAGVAQAASSVTLYGVVDVGLGYKQNKSSNYGARTTWTKTRQIGAVANVKNGSRWGLKGTEDLGNGTAVIFQLESGFDPATGFSGQGGRLFGRKAILGLTGESWGTFTIGRQYNVADDFVSGIDPFGTGWGNAGAGSTFGDSLSSRQSPTFKYLSPNYDGFKFGVGFGHSDSRTTNHLGLVSETTSTLLTTGLGYKNGGLEIGASFDYDRNKVNHIVVRDSKAWTLGAAYEFSPVTVHFAYGQQRDGFVGGNAGLAGAHGLSGWDSKGLRAQSWLGGLSFKASDVSKVLFSYQGGRLKHNNFAGVRIDTHVWGLGYQQDLSKRTHVYVLGSYGQSKWKQTGRDRKATFTDAVVGLQHRF